jgi:hypothetical protein
LRQVLWTLVTRLSLGKLVMSATVSRGSAQSALRWFISAKRVQGRPDKMLADLGEKSVRRQNARV